MAIAKHRLYLTADRSRVVEEGDTDAAYLLVAAGTEIKEHEIGVELMKQVRKFEKPEAKAVKAAPEDKAVKGAEDK